MRPLGLQSCKNPTIPLKSVVRESVARGPERGSLQTYRSGSVSRLEGGLAVRHDTLPREPGLPERALSAQSAHRVRVQQRRDEPLGRVRHARPRLPGQTATVTG